MSHTALRNEPFGVDEPVEAVSHPGAGAVVVFIGRVRDHSEGKAVCRLEYEAYESMAARELAAVADEVEAELAGVRAAVYHRVGTLHVGDVAVVCAASGPHREEAFRACRLLIDRIKARVPIWKKEHSPDGTHWVGWSE